MLACSPFTLMQEADRCLPCPGRFGSTRPCLPRNPRRADRPRSRRDGSAGGTIPKPYSCRRITAEKWSEDVSGDVAHEQATPIDNWTEFYIGSHVGGAFGGENNIQVLVSWPMATTACSWAAGRSARNPIEPNWVFALKANYRFLELLSLPQPRVVHQPARLYLGPAMLYAKGGYAQADTS